MKTIIPILLLLFSFTCVTAQEHYKWSKVKQAELFYFKEYPGKEDISNLKEENRLKCDEKLILKHFKNLRKSPHSFDHLKEDYYIVARLHFEDSIVNFIVFPDQGFLMNIDRENNSNQYLFANKKQLKALLDDCISTK